MHLEKIKRGGACLGLAMLVDMVKHGDCALREELREIPCSQHLYAGVRVFKQRFEHSAAFRQKFLNLLYGISTDIETAFFERRLVEERSDREKAGPVPKALGKDRALGV